MGGSMRFEGLDGARGALAWLVVLDHLVLLSGATTLKPWVHSLMAPGGYAVLVFVILSGFVITHLLLNRPEPYRAYLVRRFFRLYPAYFVALTASFVVVAAFSHLQTSMPWADPNAAGHARTYLNEAAAGRVPLQAVAHLLMLHGLIPSSILPDSQYLFLTPAWSLSLEWQFYLVAPAVIGLATAGRRGAASIFAIALTAFGIYHTLPSGTFVLPSALPGAGLFFLVGIFSRIACTQLKGRSFHLLAAGISLTVVGAAYKWMVPVGLWLILLGTVLAEDGQAPDFMVAANRWLSSAPLRYLGDLSYSVYLLHWPVIAGALLVTYSQGFDVSGGVAIVIACSLIGTLVAAALVHRFVEKPGIKLGKKIGRRWADDERAVEGGTALSA